MMQLLDLPREFLIHLLVDWLDIGCYGRLDSSYCSRSQRDSLLQTFRDSKLCLRQADIGIISDKHTLTWAWKKLIAIEAMIIPSTDRRWTLDYDLFSTYLKEKGHKLLHLGEVHYNQYSYGFFEQIPEYLNSTQLTSVLKYCPNLVELEDISTECVTLVTMAALRRNCKYLKVLSIQHHFFEFWDPTPMIALVAGGDCAITHLRLPSIQNFMSKFAIIARNMKQLRYLRFDRLRDITALEGDDQTFIVIAENCLNLESLFLPSTQVLRDSSLAALATGCRALRELDISRCRHVTSTGLTTIVRSCSNLTALNLTECDLISDAGIVALARSCPQLARLNLEHLSLLTDTSLTALGEHCSCLCELNVSYCSLLTTAGLTAVVSGGAQLSKLELNMCTGLSADCVQAIVTHCPELRYIALKSVGWMNDATARALVHGCPLLYKQQQPQQQHTGKETVQQRWEQEQDGPGTVSGTGSDLDVKSGGLALGGCVGVSRACREEMESMGALSFK